MRKTIAVCVSGYDWECESKIVYGIYKRALQEDCNILIFSSLLNVNKVQEFGVGIENIVQGEAEIYNLINYDMIDGLIIISGTLISSKAVERIIDKCNSHKVPIVNIHSNHPRIKVNIQVEGMSAFVTLIEHLILEHKCKTINFIGGFPDNAIADRRLNTYKSVLEKHNIPVEDKRIGFGYFWDRAVDVVKKFIADDIMPDAIVCANDSMAIFVMDYLKNQGYKVPEDVIVTGYDGFTTGTNYDIPITSVMHDYEKAGNEAFTQLVKLINNESIPEKTVISSLLLKRCSCGCMKKEEKESDYFKDKNVNELSQVMYYTQKLSYMNWQVSIAEDSQTLFDCLLRGLEPFNFTRVYFCINQNLENKGLMNFEKKLNAAKYGLSNKMISVMAKGHNVKNGTVFDTKQMLPEDVLNLPNAICLAFLPVFFKDHYLGYICFEPWEIHGNGELFGLWLMTTGTHIGSFYAKKELENMYISDPLTGLYNRRGMNMLFERASKQIKAEKQNCAIICSDIDGLKSINDKYGHEAGDKAIVASGDAIKKSLPKGSICVRTGGDEFCSLVYSPRKIDVQKMLDKIELYLEKFNMNSELPFKVFCSSGYCLVNGEELNSLAELQNLADKQLYIEKKKRK